MNDKLLSFLGICMRAKKLVIGADVCVKSAQQGNSYLILYAEDFSANSLKKVAAAARQDNRHAQNQRGAELCSWQIVRSALG